MQAQNQFTIYDLNDVYTGSSAPASPYIGQLWVDTSQTPPVTKVYTGSAWKEQNGTDDLRTNKADSEGGENAAGKFGWSLTEDGFVLYSNGEVAFYISKNGNGIFKGSVEAQAFIGADEGEISELKTEKVVFPDIGEIKPIAAEYTEVNFTASATMVGNNLRVQVSASEPVPQSTTISVSVYWISPDYVEGQQVISLTIQSGQSRASASITVGEGSTVSYAVATPNRKIYQTSTGNAPLLACTTHFVPATSGDLSSGSSTHKWSEVWATTGTIQTSDRNEKKEIAPLDERFEALFDRLRPKQFKFIQGTSDRTHTGLVAQEVEEDLLAVGFTTKDFAGFIKSEGGYGLRYDEFLALCISEIQKLKARVAELEEKKT